MPTEHHVVRVNEHYERWEVRWGKKRMGYQGTIDDCPVESCGAVVDGSLNRMKNRTEPPQAEFSARHLTAT